MGWLVATFTAFLRPESVTVGARASPEDEPGELQCMHGTICPHLPPFSYMHLLTKE